MKLQSFLVCDDIRREIGNKSTAVGIYNDRIYFNVTPDKKDMWPKVMKLGVLVRLLVEEEEKPAFFKIYKQFNQKESKLLSDGKFPPIDSSRRIYTIAVVNNNFKFDEAGGMIFFIELLDEDNNNIFKLSTDFAIQVEEVVTDQELH
ncbi:MAG: hypothetical protein OEV64_09185 [Desulfobulbaceae bacterium]|nr:hypothetical protein [Desulfobulbaceae bacterium]